MVSVIAGVQRIDQQAKGSGAGFRLIILPGVVVWWPLLLRRWLRGDGQPPVERNAHRDHALESGNDSAAPASPLQDLATGERQSLKSQGGKRALTLAPARFLAAREASLYALAPYNEGFPQR